MVMLYDVFVVFFFFQAEDGIRDRSPSRGLGDVYKRQFLGFICKAREARNLETKQWVKVRAKIAYEFWQDYDGVGPVLYAESVEPAEEIKEIVQF